MPARVTKSQKFKICLKNIFVYVYISQNSNFESIS